MEQKKTAIILAGGSGSRMNAPVPKQFMELASKPVIMYALERFSENTLISDIVVVCCADHLDILNKLTGEERIGKIHRIVPGGVTRQESSFIGIKNCPPDTELVMIHDAVRPFVTARIIKETHDAALETGAAAVVTGMDDTVIMEKNGFIEKIPDRAGIRRIQTPQGFRYGVMLEAHEHALKNGVTDSTDDCGLVLAMGRPVKVVEGDPANIKLTTPVDILLAEKLLDLHGV